MLDTTRAYETPEGIVLELKVAGPVVRACAWTIDALIRMGLYLVLLATFAYLGGVGWAIVLIGFFLIEWFYPAVFEALYGATPGKRAMGIHVIHDDGTPLSWSSSLVRNLMRAADFFPAFYGFGLLSTLANPDFKRLGDLAAGTLVVYLEKPRTRGQLPAVEPKPLVADLSVEEQGMLLDFVERRDRLSDERLEELAGMVPQLTSKHGAEAVKELFAYAHWLAKGK